MINALMESYSHIPQFLRRLRNSTHLRACYDAGLTPCDTIVQLDTALERVSKQLVENELNKSVSTIIIPCESEQAKMFEARIAELKTEISFLRRYCDDDDIERADKAHARYKNNTRPMNIVEAQAMEDFCKTLHQRIADGYAIPQQIDPRREPSISDEVDPRQARNEGTV